jgi:hypothetical protein
VKEKKLPPPPINPSQFGAHIGMSILAICQNMKNGWNRFPENAGDVTRRTTRWTNDDGTVWPDDYEKCEH